MDTSSPNFERVVHDLSIVRPWILRSALTIGLLDAIADAVGGKNDIAAALGIDERVCGEVIEYLIAIGYVDDIDDQRLNLTERGQALSQFPHDLYEPSSPVAIFDRAASELNSAWLSGGPVQSRRVRPYWDEVAELPRACETVGRYQPRSVQFDGEQLVAAIRAELTSSGDSVVDLGGSNGALARDLSAFHPGRIGVLDLPAMIANARSNLSDVTADQFAFHGASFFETVPSEYEVYVLNAILYDYSDQQVAQLLSRIHESMKATSVLVISELLSMFSDRYTQAESSLMLTLNTGGRSRSVSDVASMAQTAGFSSPRVVRSSERRFTLVFDR